MSILFLSLSGMELQFGIRHHESLQAPQISRRSAQTSSRWMQHALMTSSSPVMRSDTFVARITEFMKCRSIIFYHHIYPTWTLQTVQAFFTEDTALCLSTWTAREDLTPKCAGVGLASSAQLSPDGDPIEHSRNPFQAYLRELFLQLQLEAGAILGTPKTRGREFLGRPVCVSQLCLQGWCRWAYWRARHVWEGCKRLKGLTKLDKVWYGGFLKWEYPKIDGL